MQVQSPCEFYHAPLYHVSIYDTMLGQFLISWVVWLTLYYGNFKTMKQAIPISYQQALAAWSLTVRPNRSAERSPSVLLPPWQGLTGIPSRAVCTDGVEVPVVLSRIVDIVCGTNIRCLLRACCSSEAEHKHYEQTHSRHYCVISICIWFVLFSMFCEEKWVLFIETEMHVCRC